MGKDFKMHVKYEKSFIRSTKKLSPQIPQNAKSGISEQTFLYRPHAGEVCWKRLVLRGMPSTNPNLSVRQSH